MVNTKIIDGKAIAERIRNEIRDEMGRLPASIKPLKLVAVQAGDDSASSIYTRQQEKLCEKNGIMYELKKFGPDISAERLAGEIEKLNLDDGVTAVILQMPLPAGMDPLALQSAISPLKDAEGVHPANMGRVIYGKPCLAPCTVLAVMEIIYSTGVALEGREVVVVGHSGIVGKPAALLLLDRLATVTVCHVGTSMAGMLESHVRRADILVVAAGKAGLVPGDWVKEGAVVVDVGINRQGDRIVGDVGFETASKRAAYITPVPGGVGPVTTAMLLKNVVEAAKWKIKV